MSTVYFTREISPEKVIALYKALNIDLPGKVAVKFHSGEVGNQNFIRPPFWKPMVDYVHGTLVECNTAYAGERTNNEDHWKTIQLHGWPEIAEVDLMDAEGEMLLPVPNGKVLENNIVGSHLTRYDSMLVLSHFKGHPLGGFGGALKNVAIGVASSKGKGQIHGGMFDEMMYADHTRFLEAMADATASVVKHFGGNMAFINVMCNMSVDCDCCAVAEDPALADIGMLASLDPIALDQACVDLVYASDDPGKEHLIERIESRNGIHTIEAAAALGYGSRTYELVSLD